MEQDGTIQNLRYMLDHLSPSIEQLKLKSKSILTDWQDYNRLLLQMEKILREAEAEIDRVETSAMNVETYEMSTRKAQVSIVSLLSRLTTCDALHRNISSWWNPIDVISIRSSLKHVNYRASAMDKQHWRSTKLPIGSNSNGPSSNSACKKSLGQRMRSSSIGDSSTTPTFISSIG